MKNKNILNKSPNEPFMFKRSASHSLRSSLRIPRKLNNAQSAVVTNSALPSYIPPKAAALLEIPLPPVQIRTNGIDQKLKIAAIRKRSVWANSAASKIHQIFAVSLDGFLNILIFEFSLYVSTLIKFFILQFILEITLPTHSQDDNAGNISSLPRTLDNLVESSSFRDFKFTEAEETTMDEGVLKESNKNSSSDAFKAIKKHKFGHSKKPEINVLCGKLDFFFN